MRCPSSIFEYLTGKGAGKKSKGKGTTDKAGSDKSKKNGKDKSGTCDGDEDDAEVKDEPLSQPDNQGKNKDNHRGGDSS